MAKIAWIFFPHFCSAEGIGCIIIIIIFKPEQPNDLSKLCPTEV